MKQISTKEVEVLLNEKAPINLIDVREVDEVQAGKIPGALHIPLGLVEFKMQDLDKSKEYILVCRSGGRSARAAKFLEDYGFNVINMTGGMLEWKGTVE
ncbi:rhodanese-like domain-containing protein [Sporosarcina sp. Marseille-Q4063]|uniref:rhodanese-like domain-containing protein n=1 Tax=Sporosarcina sp. Marseille-Q4063 TaxID=2810514 RepID=UPI001BAF23CB|nr:rhodanese-like domain-containing protein [Sporosarcina sp. Marseille-Q4063]QUW22929.1 rhodanese-like domain-containing protein [Sporosarcina sp. Marseille-Q4063]